MATQKKLFVLDVDKIFWRNIGIKKQLSIFKKKKKTKSEYLN